MGYNTDFSGSVSIDPVLSKDQVKYLQSFNATRRMKRDAKIAGELQDLLRKSVGLPIGEQAEYYVGDSEWYGDVLEINTPPATQPSLWCQWTVNDAGDTLEWDGDDKFYNYIEWMEYLIKHFFDPWGKSLEGQINWYGEDHEDQGIIKVGNCSGDKEVTNLKNKVVIEEVKGNEIEDEDEDEDEWDESDPTNLSTSTPEHYYFQFFVDELKSEGWTDGQAREVIKQEIALHSNFSDSSRAINKLVQGCILKYKLNYSSAKTHPWKRLEGLDVSNCSLKTVGELIGLNDLSVVETLLTDLGLEWDKSGAEELLDMLMKEEADV